MTILAFSALLLAISFLAGLLGALTGLGGGIVIIPVLVLFFHVNMHYAMGASLITVIATSSGTAAAYMREGYTNLRIGIFLEVAAVLGAFMGALLVTMVPITLLTVIFSSILIFSAYLTFTRKEQLEKYQTSHPWATVLRLDGTYPRDNKLQAYHVQRAPLAFILMGFAGIISGLLGIGSGTLKVLAMDQAMRLPYKVSTTTSNFMIGITAATSAGLYFSHGYINAALTFPVMLGVIVGSIMGAKLLHKIHTDILRKLFSLILCLIAVEMLYNVFYGVT